MNCPLLQVKTHWRCQHHQQQQISSIHAKTADTVSCAVCCKQSDVVRMHGHKSRLPPTATEAGTVYRKTVVDDRIASPWHIEAKKCECLSKLSKVKIAQQAPLNQAVSTRAQHLLRWATVWTVWAQ